MKINFMTLFLLAVVGYVVYQYFRREGMTDYTTIITAVVLTVWALLTIGLIVYVLYI